MKKGSRILSFILVLSLIFTSLVFTTSAAEEESSNNVGDYIDENIKVYTPSANYTEITDKKAADTAFNKILIGGGDTSSIGKESIFGGANLSSYLVTADNQDDYIMLIPGKDAITKGQVADHVQINTRINSGGGANVITYDSSNPKYYIFECSVATESNVLPIYYEIITRDMNNKDEGKGRWMPSDVSNSLYMTMTPGVFHHLTLIGDIDNNILYVYIDNQLVISVNQGVASNNLHSSYKSGASMKVEGYRIQIAPGITVTDDMSLCMKDIHERLLMNGNDQNLSQYIGLPTLTGWNGNRYTGANDKLPPMIKVNGVEYNNTIDATKALSGFAENNEAEMMRSVLSGAITVDCNATINTYSSNVTLEPGTHTKLTKLNLGTTLATLIAPKLSTTLIESNPSTNLFQYLGYNLAGNMINEIKLVDMGGQDTVNADIMKTGEGHSYISVYDNSSNAFNSSTHAYMDVRIPMNDANKIDGHDFIVFDFDIYSESEFINIYNSFIPRASDGTGLSYTEFFLTSDASSLGNVICIEMESGIWNHFTFVGEVSTGKAYVYINNILVSAINNGLYVQQTNEYGQKCAKAPNGTLYPIEDVYINSFRCMQIYGGNKSGQTLTQNMSVCSDNFDARFVDGDPTLVPGMADLSTWTTNVYGNGYQFQDMPAIASVDGELIYDIYSLSEILNGNGYKTTKKNVSLLRQFVGAVNVSCRAEIVTNGFGIDNLVFADSVTVTESSGPYGKPVKSVYYKETEDSIRDVMITVPYQEKISATNGTDIMNAIKRDDTNNLYYNHAISSGTASYLAWQIFDKNGNAIAQNQYDKYLLDQGAQTHTITLNTATLTPKISVTEAKVGDKSWLSSNATVDYQSTKQQYYLITEFDMAYKNNDSSASSLSIDISGQKYSVIANLKTLLTNQSVAQNTFAHVTVIATIDPVPTFNITTSTSGGLFSNTTYTVSWTGMQYNFQYKVYVNNALVSTSSSTSLGSEDTSGTSFTWNGITINSAASQQIAIDNLYLNHGTETITEALSKSVNVRNISNNNFYSSIVTANSTKTDNGDTSLDNAFEITSGSITQSGIKYDTATLPEDPVNEGSVPSTEEVYTPIANVNGTVYNSNQEEALRELLENSSNSKEVLNVTILRTPDQPYTVGANAIIDTNGLGNDFINYDVGNEYEVTTNGDTTTVIVIGKTHILAKLNDVEYYNIDELQTALTLSKNAALEFYSQPESAVSITCPATIVTNGFTGLYTVDEYVYSTSESSGVITISAHTETPNIKLIVGGVETINKNVEYGTDIAKFLMENGVVSNAAVTENGNIYTGTTFTSSVASYLVDGKPAGRITEDVVFNVSYSEEWTEPFIIINNEGNIVTPSAYNGAGFISALNNSSTGAIILGEDLEITTTSNTLASSENINVYLNGHTLTYNVPANSTHAFILGNDTDVDYKFYGPGVIDSTSMCNTQGLFYSNVGYTGTITLKDLEINVAHAIGQLRDGHMELIGCDVNAYIPTTSGGSNVGLSGLFSLGEDYNTSQSKKELSLIIASCDVDFRYYEISDRYNNRSLNIPLVYHKIVTSNGTDPKTTVLIDNSVVNAQGSLVSAYHTNGGSAPLSSNMKFWINESTVLAKNITNNEIKSGSVIFYENVRTNIEDVNSVSLTANLVKTNSSDGIAPYVFTSHDYAVVNWSNGKSEFWAAGSLPINSACKFDNTEIVEAGKTYNLSSTTTTAPFTLYANLTLSDVIGFNIYIPSSQNVSKVYLDDKIVEKGTKSDGSDTTYVKSADAECYFYSVYFAPQEAAKEFTLLIVLGDGTEVSRKLSVGIYANALYNSLGKMDEYNATKNRELLSVALYYIEQATIYSGYTIDMGYISTILNQVGVTAFSLTATTTDMSALSAYFKNAQINIDSTCAFRFNAADGVDLNSLTGLTFTVDGTERAFTISADGSYAELSLRGFDMAKMITITVEGATGTYDLYTYYAALVIKAGTSSTEACACNQALQVIKALYTYAQVASNYPVKE